MVDADLVSLLVRTVVSLAVVLAVVAVAYAVAKRRGNRASAPAPARRRGRGAKPSGVEVVGRVGLNRSTAAVALRFGDRVLLVSSSEQAGTQPLSEMSAADWDELHTVREPLAETSIVSGADRTIGPRPTFLEALRQATARHA